MTNLALIKRKKSRPKPAPRHNKKLGIALIAAFCFLTERAQAALSTICSHGEYLILDEDNLQLRQGVCATCPRGKSPALQNQNGLLAEC